jgi:hypothetical protein
MSNTNELLKSLKNLNEEKETLQTNIKEMFIWQKDLDEDVEKYEQEVDSLNELIKKVQKFNSKISSLKTCMFLNSLNLIIVILISIVAIENIQRNDSIFWLNLLTVFVYSALIIHDLGSKSEWNYQNFKSLFVQFKKSSEIKKKSQEKISKLLSRKSDIMNNIDYTRVLKRKSARTLREYNELSCLVEDKLISIQEDLFKEKDCIVRFNFA